VIVAGLVTATLVVDFAASIGIALAEDQTIAAPGTGDALRFGFAMVSLVRRRDLAS
jgi:hypothetical protein